MSPEPFISRALADVKIRTIGYNLPPLRPPGRRFIETALLVAAVVLILLFPPVRHAILPPLAMLATGQLATFRDHLLALGAWAPSVSITLMLIEAVAVPVPVTIIMIANGLVFGTWRGMLVSLSGGLVGAIAAYFLARRFGRVLVEHVVPSTSLAVGDRLMAKYGRWALVLARWIPGVPGDPMSYAAGLTRVPFTTFLVATTVGLVPANLATAYFGDQVAGNVPIAAWLAGLAAVVLALIVWRRLRRRRAQAE